MRRGERTLACIQCITGLLSQGLEPLQFLWGLGKDLQAVEGSLGLKGLIEGLRNPRDHESALLELSLGAMLAASGHQVEFRPKLPNGKEADFVSRKGEEQVFFEVKKARKSEARLAASEFSSRLLQALADLARPPDGPLIDWHFDVQLSSELLAVLGAGRDADAHLIEGLVARIIRDALSRVKKGQVSFEIERVGSFVFDPTKGVKDSGVSSSFAEASVELRRILRSHLTDAVSQLHQDFPGIIVIQSSGELDEDEVLSRLIVTSLFSSMSAKVRHVSAVVFLPVTYWIPTRWAIFNAFAVFNPSAAVKAEELDAFREFSGQLLTEKVATPSG